MSDAPIPDLTFFQAIWIVWNYRKPQNYYWSHFGAFWAIFDQFWVLQNQFLGHPTPAMGSNKSCWMPPCQFNFFPGDLNHLDPLEPTKLFFEPFWSILGHFWSFLGQFWAPQDKFLGLTDSLIGPIRLDWMSLGGKYIIVILALSPLSH